MTRGFSPADRRALLAIARVALEAAVCRRQLLDVPGCERFARPAGAFVTLTASGDLRGCIGRPEPNGALGTVVVECAGAAALADPRFSPVQPDELARILIEISVLSPLAPLIDCDQIEVGRHGIVVAADGRRGLLLPQVAAEWGWTRDEFLAHACRKAGLPPDAWRHGAQVHVFEAEILRESDP